MYENRGPKKHYDTDFKLKVIEEIEAGRITIWGAREKYGIGGKMTIQEWLRKLGKGHLIQGNQNVDYLAMSKRADQKQQLEDRNKTLEAALVDAQLKIIALESLVEVASEHYGENIKKNFGSEALKRQKRKRRGAESL